MRVAVWYVLGALSAAACEPGAPARVQAPADSASGEVAFSLAGPNNAAMIVPVRINGREPVDFIVDTGATLTCIDVSLARELGLPEDDAAGGIALGVATAGRIQTVHMDSLRVGNAAAFDLSACRLDLANLRRAFGAQGLLGLNFLKSFHIAIDFERNVMTLRGNDDE
jgi:predicted aspartyl protease